MTFHLLLISVLEGLTEFLPISSTAHLILASKIFHLDLTVPYVKFFLLCIQLGALLAGVSLFARRILFDKKLFVHICISFIPSAVIGFALYKVFKKLLEGNLIILAAALFLGGIIFIYLEKIFMRSNGIGQLDAFGTEEMTKKDALIVGIAQAVAIVPGVSRSGATIIAGILRGIKKATIIEYTFILALPTLAAAVVYDIYKSRDMLAGIHSYSEIILGCTISFVVAVITLRVMKKYLPRISLTAFGWYRIILAIVVLFFTFS